MACAKFSFDLAEEFERRRWSQEVYSYEFKAIYCRSTVWTTENIFCHMLIAVTFNAFYGIKIGANLHQN